MFVVETDIFYLRKNYLVSETKLPYIGNKPNAGVNRSSMVTT